MIVEFVGLPGAGKSYLAKEYAKERSWPLMHISNRLEKYFFVLLFVIIKPIAFFHFLKSVVSETPGNTPLLRWKITVLFLPAVAKEAKARLHKNAVIDEGLFQFIMSTHERRISNRDLVSYDKMLDPRKYEVIIVEANRDVRQGRMIERKRIPRAPLGLDYAKGRLSLLESNYSVIRLFITARYIYKLVENGRMGQVLGNR